MKYIVLFTLLFSASVQAKIYDAFMCYTQVNTVVLFGILKEKGTLRINHYRLDQNPTTIDLKMTRYDRSDSSIIATGEYQGKKLIQINSKGGFGKADIDLTPFPGAEDVSFVDEDILCYFGRFED